MPRLTVVTGANEDYSRCLEQMLLSAGRRRLNRNYRFVAYDLGLLPETRGRLLTDLSGQFFTLVAEFETASLGEWEKGFAEAMRDPAMGEIFGKTIELIDTGHREFYTIVS